MRSNWFLTAALGLTIVVLLLFDPRGRHSENSTPFDGSSDSPVAGIEFPSPVFERCDPVPSESGAEATASFLLENRSGFESAFFSGLDWLSGLSVDPFELRDRNIKGKKKLAELVGIYARVYRAIPVEDQEDFLRRISEVVAITYDPLYHDMSEVDDKHFKEDATSYMRIAYLMDGLGLDTSLYREEILKVKPRLDSHMKHRGSHQQMAFHWYYDHFGFSEPFPLDRGFERGLISARRDPYRFSRGDAYHLTHEIFVPYRYGEKLDAEFFAEDEKNYLKRVLQRLTVHYIMLEDPDLTAELVSCLRYLEFTDLEVYREGLAYLLESQNRDGSWGNYERSRKKYGDYVDHGFYLHTTAVVLDALIVSFVFPGGDYLPVSKPRQENFPSQQNK